MFKKIDKVLAALGNVGAMQRLHVDTFTEDKMEKVDGEKIGTSDVAQLFVGLQELNGYLFLETLIICIANVKTFNGATLQFKSANGDFTLKSDTQELESDHSNVSNRYMCQCSFDINKEQIERIRNRDFQTVVYSFKKKQMTMDMVPAIVNAELNTEEE